MQQDLLSIKCNEPCQVTSVGGGIGTARVVLHLSVKILTFSFCIWLHGSAFNGKNSCF